MNSGPESQSANASVGAPVVLPDVHLATDAILLRPWEPDDADWYVSARDDEVYRWTTEPADLTVEQARASIESHRALPRYAAFAVVDRMTGRLVGSVGLAPVSETGEVAEVSYWIAPEGRGRGAATAAVRLLVSWAFEAWAQLERIELQTLPENAASQRVAERTGFKHEALLPQHKRMHGAMRDMVMFAMERESARAG